MILGALFFIVALVYAGVGFGGGSSYLALLVLWGVPYAVIPPLALICNIVVVAGSSVMSVRAGHLNKRLLLPLIVTSVPMAYLGGRLPIGKDLFLIVLFFSLLVSGLRLLHQHRSYDDTPDKVRRLPLWLSTSLGAALGFLAGITGIGGGIFLSPILYHLRAGTPRQIATTASLFILVNSLSGLMGQLHKDVPVDALHAYWILPLLAFIGGQLGNRLMLRWLPARVIALLTALLVLFVAGQLGLRISAG